MAGKLTPDLSDEDIRLWESLYWRWTQYHARAFGWDGPQGKESAHELFLYWEKLFFAFLPDERELEDATDWAVGFQENFEIKWQAHYAMIRTRIADLREESQPGAKTSIELLERTDQRERNETARRLRQRLAAKLTMPETTKPNAAPGFALMETLQAASNIGRPGEQK